MLNTFKNQTCYCYGREKVLVGVKKINLIIQGQGSQKTTIAWNDTAASSKGTIYSYTVCIDAKNFIAYDIGFKVMQVTHTYESSKNNIFFPLNIDMLAALFSNGKEHSSSSSARCNWRTSCSTESQRRSISFL